jgi:hypothetical protein
MESNRSRPTFQKLLDAIPQKALIFNHPAARTRNLTWIELNYYLDRGDYVLNPSWFLRRKGTKCHCCHDESCDFLDICIL